MHPYSPVVTAAVYINTNKIDLILTSANEITKEFWVIIATCCSYNMQWLEHENMITLAFPPVVCPSSNLVQDFLLIP